LAECFNTFNLPDVTTPFILILWLRLGRAKAIGVICG